MVSFLYLARRYEDAVRQAQKTFELDSTIFQVDVERARALGELRRCDETVPMLSRARKQNAAVLKGAHGYRFALSGGRGEAAALLEAHGAVARKGKDASR